VSTAYDVYNRFIVDIVTDRYRGSKTAGAKEHIQAAREIVEERPVRYIFNRNYASMEFMDYLEQ
jgi:hypothetical protein